MRPSLAASASGLPSTTRTQLEAVQATIELHAPAGAQRAEFAACMSRPCILRGILSRRASPAELGVRCCLFPRGLRTDRARMSAILTAELLALLL